VQLPLQHAVAAIAAMPLTATTVTVIDTLQYWLSVCHIVPLEEVVHRVVCTVLSTAD
jgi:hypothetical protein